MPYMLLHTNSLMALSLALIMGSMWVLVSNSAAKTPSRYWLLIFYCFQTLWQSSEFFHYAIHPTYIGDLPYKLLISVSMVPALAILEVAYIQFNYHFLHDTYPRERRIMLWVSGAFAACFCGAVAWNEFMNQSDMNTLNSIGFVYGMLTNAWILGINVRKYFALRHTDPVAAQGAGWLAVVNAVFVFMCVVVVIFGFYSKIGYWTYCIFLWSGNLAEIVVYLIYSAIPIKLSHKQLGFTQIVAATILLTVMLVFCPPVDLLDVPARMAQQDSLLKLLFLIIGSASLIFGLLPQLMDSSLTQPVLRLLNGVQRIDTGDLSVRVEPTTQDEVGTLTRHFNQMTRSLSEARADLTHYAQTLEEQVAERTAELQADKARIQEQSEQLQTVMRELHHRVKNNLAIVSGLLSLQLNRLEDQQAIKAFQEGQRRIEAIALIHQRLYQSKEVTSIHMGKFVEELTISTMYAYGYSPDSVRLHIDSDINVLDIDTAVPLSLIINELLTNCFKYAIPHVPDPSLSIVMLNRNGLLLEVADNGPGLDIDIWNRPTTSFGKRLIKGLSEQTGGILTVENRTTDTTDWHTATLGRGEATARETTVADYCGTLFRLYIPELKLMQ